MEDSDNSFAIHDKDDHWLCDIHFNSYNRQDWKAATKKDALAQACKNGIANVHKAYRLTSKSPVTKDK